MGGPPGAPPGGASTNRADKEKIKELEWQTMELQQQLRKSEENSSRIERELRSSKQKLDGVEKELRTVGTKDREIAALSRKVAEIGEHLRETQEASIRALHRSGMHIRKRCPCALGAIEIPSTEVE